MYICNGATSGLLNRLRISAILLQHYTQHLGFLTKFWVLQAETFHLMWWVEFPFLSLTSEHISEEPNTQADCLRWPDWTQANGPSVIKHSNSYKKHWDCVRLTTSPAQAVTNSLDTSPNTRTLQAEAWDTLMSPSQHYSFLPMSILHSIQYPILTML